MSGAFSARRDALRQDPGDLSMACGALVTPSCSPTTAACRYCDLNLPLMLPSTFFSLLSPLLSWLTHDAAKNTTGLHDIPQSLPLQFTLRHLHASVFSSKPRTVFQDVPESSASLYATQALSGSIPTRRLRVNRPSSHEAFMAARQRSLRFQETAALDWDQDEVLAPDVTKRETLLLLAKMTSNSYYAKPGTAGWYALGDDWNVVSLFINSVTS